MLKLKLGKQYKHRESGIFVQITAIQNGQHQNLTVHFTKLGDDKNLELSSEEFRSSFASKGAAHA